MSLSNGIYIVTSVAGDRHIGRFPVEDRSLLPKQLFALPEGIEPPRVRSFITGIIENVSDDISLLFICVAYPREE